MLVKPARLNLIFWLLSTTIMMMCLFVLPAVHPQQADAATLSMSVGQYKIKSLSKYYDFATVSSSNTKVVRCGTGYFHSDYDDPNGKYMVVGYGFGTATVTIKYRDYISYDEYLKRLGLTDKEYEEAQQDDSTYQDDYAMEYFLGDLPSKVVKTVSYPVRVNSTTLGTIGCDGLVTGSNYSITRIFGSSSYLIRAKASGVDRWYEYFTEDSFYDPDYDKYTNLKGTALMSGQKSSGKFVKGKGYKVCSKGKQIRFTKSGKVVVNFKVNGKTYRITCNKVHSRSSYKKASVKSLRRQLLIPSSLIVKKTSLHWDSYLGTYYCDIRYSAKNKYGVRISASDTLYFIEGKWHSEDSF